MLTDDMKIEQKNAVKFKVRDMSTGLYQDAKLEKLTSGPSWSKRGKTWTDIVELKKHFAALELFRITLSPLWEVIEYQACEESGDRYPASIMSNKNNHTL